MVDSKGNNNHLNHWEYTEDALAAGTFLPKYARYYDVCNYIIYGYEGMVNPKNIGGHRIHYV